jgi:hypothetical protein
MTAKRLSASEQLKKLEAKKAEMQQKQKQIEAKAKALRSKVASNERKLEESVKYALGGLILKLITEKSGGVYIIEGESKSIARLDEIVELLPEAQKTKAREILNKAFEAQNA